MRNVETMKYKKSAIRSSIFFLCNFAFLLAVVPLNAAEEEFYCEVMDVQGEATVSNSTTSGKPLAEGDLLSVNDIVEVGASSYVDVAYDRDWSNVTRIEENSKIRLRSLFPTTIDLEKGGVFAKLKSLPKDSTFDVQTPTRSNFSASSMRW